MKGFRPSLWSTLALIAVGSGLLNLGFWQVDRYGQQQARKAKASENLAKPAIEISTTAALQSQPEWRRVAIRGEFSGAQGGVINKYVGGVHGRWLVAPLRLADGGHIVVMRGWVPESEGAMLPPRGPVTVRGLLQEGSGDLDAAIGKGEFRSLGGYAILAEYGLSGVRQVLVEGELVAPGQPFPKALPVRGFYGFIERRPHLEYAGTWFGLALALLGIWIYAGRRRARA